MSSPSNPEEPESQKLQDELDFARAVADWMIDFSASSLEAGNVESALQYAHVAAGILIRQNRDLASDRLEAILRAAGRLLLEKSEHSAKFVRESEGPKVCLHVLNEALPAGGLTAMARRWIEMDAERIHCVALLSGSAPFALEAAVQCRGGQIFECADRATLADSAIWLRRLASERADLVVLHVGPDDVIAAAAFGLSGGPPVMLVNHAAHCFWIGASIADRVLNCRGSKLECYWTSHYRGTGESRSAIVPIPLAESQTIKPSEEERNSVRSRHGIGEDVVLALTVGSAFKYLPAGNIDFLSVWQQLLQDNAKLSLLAVGFEGDERWKAAAARFGSRIRTIGPLPQAELQALLAGADLYVEGFPFGTTTALLEAAARGIPACLAPADAPPPYGTDGIAIDPVLTRPASQEDYLKHVQQLCNDAATRLQLGRDLRASVLSHHSGEGWQRQLNTVVASLPSMHAPADTIGPVPTEPQIHELWARFLPKWSSGYERTLETALTRALMAGLRPRANPALVELCARYKRVRAVDSVPTSQLLLFLKSVPGMLPAAWSATAFRILVFVNQRSLIERIWSKALIMSGRRSRRPSAYDEYRKSPTINSR